MSAIVLRAVLASILAATIVVKVHAAVTPRISVPEAASQLLQEHGFMPVSNGGASWTLAFSVPNCQRSLGVETVSLYWGQSDTSYREIRPGYLRRFVYLGREWPSQDRFAMREEWLKHRFFSLFGLSPYVPMAMALLVDEPIGCPATKTIDWSNVWMGRPIARTASEIAFAQQRNSSDKER